MQQKVMALKQRSNSRTGLRSNSRGPAENESGSSMIIKLLRGFKLNQYATKMADQGYGQDIFKLAVLSHREKEDLMNSLQLLPGHKERMQTMFKTIDQLNPQQQIIKTLQSVAPEGVIIDQNPMGKVPSNTGVRASSQSRQGFDAKRGQKTAQSKDVSDEKEVNMLSNQIVFRAEDTKAYIAQLSQKGPPNVPIP